MPTLTERLAIIITGESKSGEAAFKQVGAASKQAASQMSLAQKAVGSFTSSLSQFASSPTAIIGASAAAGAAAVGFAEHVISQFDDATEAVRAFQNVSGATAEDSSRLVAAAKAVGVDTDKLGTAVFRLAKNLDGNKEALAKYGIEIAHTKSGAVDLTGTLLNVADAVHRVGPGAEADAIAFAAFGKQAAALMEILLRGRGELEALFKAAAQHHEIFSQADLEAGEQFSVAINEFKASLTGLELAAGKELLPTATLMAKWAEDVTNAANKAADGLNRAVRSPASPIGFLASKIAGTKKPHEDLAQAAVAAAEGLEEEAKAAAADAKAVDAYGSVLKGLADAQKGRAAAAKTVERANRDEASAAKELADLLAKGAVDADKVADANKRITDTAKATTEAQKAEATSAQRVADAQQGVVDAQLALQKVAQGASAEEIAKATLARNRALRDQKRAAFEVIDAEAKKNSIVDIGMLGVGQSTGTLRDKEKAELDLADALDGVKTAEFDAQDAQKALDDTRKKGKAGSEDLKKAQDDLKAKQDELNQAIEDQATAHQNVIDKQTDQIKAHDDLVKAEEGDPDFADKVAAARQGVADAHQNTADAINNEKDAIDGLIQKQKDLAAYVASPEAQTTNVQTAAISGQDFRPVSRSASQVIQQTNVTVHTGADPNATARAIAQHASRNGGSPRG